VTGKGWRAFLSPHSANLPGTTTRDRNMRASAIGGMLAAILAINDAVKRVLRMNNVLFIEAPITFSAFDYSTAGDDAGPELPETIDVGTAVVAGLGAIGGIMVSMIPLLATPLQGSLGLVDFDVLEMHNMNRVLCASLHDVGKTKVSVAEAFLRKVPWLSQLAIKSESARLENAALLQDRRVDIIFTLVDSITGRKNAQDMLPRSVINAGTDGFTSDVFVSGSLIDGACLNCLLDPPDGLAAYARGVLIKRLEQEMGAGNVRPWQLTIEAIEAIKKEIEEKIMAETERRQKPVSIEEAVAMVARIKYTGCSEAPTDLLRLHDVDVPSPTLPQVSALPALFCIGEAIKLRHFPHAVLQNQWQTDLLGRIDYSLKQRFPRREGCSCSDEVLRKIYMLRYNVK
jgi:molybdopterin/thiamine biosynthesis adenylyltransferase